VALLDRLAKDELIVRTPVPGDRRARSIELTTAGRGVISRIEEVAQALRDELLSSFSIEELDTTSKVLTQMKLRIEASQ
jgi:MarR family transcriptional regulator for hemolysin